MASLVDTSEKPKENLLIVDALNLAFRWKHMGSTKFASDYLATVKSLAKSYKAGTVIITADWGSSTYRKEILPEYKQNRQELKDNQTEQEKREFELFWAEYENTLNLLETHFLLLRYKGVEADDLAGYLVNNKDRYGFEEIWLISSDRDWDCLIQPGVSRFSYVTRQEITVDTWDYPVPREMYSSYKCLVGDKGDNIPGIEKIGPKRAAELIQKYGDIFDIYSACPLPGNYVYINNLNNNKEQLLKNYELMDLCTYCTAAIGDSNVEDIEWRMNDYRLR